MASEHIKMLQCFRNWWSNVLIDILVDIRTLSLGPTISDRASNNQKNHRPFLAVIYAVNPVITLRH